MKKIFFVVMTLVLTIIGFVAFKLLEETEKRASPQAVSRLVVDDLELSISYSRPYKKGRKIFGGLLKYDEYWRTGADEATEIEFSRKVNFGGQSLEAGRYRLYTIPGPDKWTIAINRELGQWGKFEPNYSLDVMRLEVPVSEIDSLVEQLRIDFHTANNGADLLIQWDRTSVSVPIR